MTDVTEGTGGEGAAPDGGTVLNGDGGSAGMDFRAAMDALPEDLRDNAALQRIQNFEGLAKGFVSAQSMVGADKVVIPGEDADEAAIDEFYGKLGMPDTSDGYKLQVPETLPEGFQYNEDTAAAFKKWAHEAKLTGKQADIMHGRFVDMVSSALEGQAAAENDAVIAADKAVRETWGNDYDRNLNLASRAISVLGGEALVESLKKGGVLTGEGEVKDPVIAYAFAEAGKLMGEDMLSTSSSAELPGAAQAKEEIERRKADPKFTKALTDESDAGHDAAVKKMEQLHRLAAGA